jgi:hypothetical protein
LTPAQKSVNRFAVTARDVYSNRLFVAGFVCLVLGLGNWGVGANESYRLQNILHKTAQTGLEDSYRNFRELDHQKNQEVLRRINADREKHNSARVKLNFYYVVAAGGKLLCVIGAALTLASIVGVIRRDSDLKIKKLSILTRKE